MPPPPQNRLLPRRSSSPDNYYIIIFAVLGSAIVVGGVLWGYFLPKWQKKHRRPVQTRYNCVRRSARCVNGPEHDLELPAIFPPHPAVVVPLGKKQGSTAPHHVQNQHMISVYDPPTRSCFLNTPRSTPCPLTKDTAIRDETMPSASTQANLHTARLQQRHSYKPADPATESTSADVPGTWKRLEKLSKGQSSRWCSRNLLLVARPAGAAPVKSNHAVSAPGRSGRSFSIQKGHTACVASTSRACSAANGQTSARPEQHCRLGSNIYSEARDIGNSRVKQEISKGMCKPAYNVNHVRLHAHDKLQTPSSAATGTTKRCSSPTSRGDNSTLPTPFGSFTIQPREGSGIYPGTSNLVPSRRFQDHLPLWRSLEITGTDLGSQKKSCHSSEGANGQNHILTDGRQLLPVPPSYSGEAAMIGRGLDALSELDSITNIQLPRTTSHHTPSSSTDSLALFPRPLTLRHTMNSQPPVLSPTPLGRHVQKGMSPTHSLRYELADLPSILRGKSTGPMRHTRMSIASCDSDEQSVHPQRIASSAYQSLESNPYIDQLGLARLGGNKRRSSLVSLSTLKVPKSFRLSVAREPSSVYSRQSKGTSMLHGFKFPGESSASLGLLPEPSPRRATSFDDAIFTNLGLTLSPDDDGKAGHEASTVEPARESVVGSATLPQTPTPPEHGQQAIPETPQVGTASSHTFGRKMLAPKLSIASSSDDVFGTDARMAEEKGSRSIAGAQETNEMVVAEDGKVVNKVRAMGSKLSREDLVKYGGKTAPGGVEWL